MSPTTRRKSKAVDDAEATLTVTIPDDVDAEVLTGLLPDFAADAPSAEQVVNLYRLVIAQAEELDAKQQTIDETQAEVAKKDVELDQALQDKETQSQELDALIQSLQDELKDVKDERDKLLASNTDLQAQLARVSSTHSASSSEVQDYKHRLQDAEREKRDLVGVVSRLKQDETQREEEITMLRKNLREERTEHQNLENELRELRSSETSIKFKLESQTQQLELAKAEVERLNADFTTKSDEYTKYRRAKQTELSTLQTTLDTVSQDCESARATLKALQSSHSSQTHQLTQALTKTHDLTAQLAEQEAVFNTETNNLHRLVAILETREKASKDIVDSIENDWRETSAKADREVADIRQQLEREKKARTEAEEKVDHLETVVEKMGHGELPVMSQPIISEGAGLSSSIAIASKVQKSGKTFTEIYTDYVKLQEDYEKKCVEYEHMDRTLNDILHQIEARAPVLSEQRSQYDRLQVESQQLAAQLSQTLNDRDAQMALAHESTQKLEKMVKEKVLFEQQLTDLGRQVQTLLREVGRRDDPMLPSDEELEGVQPASDVDAMITNNLVLFKSIPELQQQNQRILRIVRELGKKMESEEHDYREQMEREQSEAVKEAHEMIQELGSQLERQKKSSDSIIQTYVKERDALKAMLHRLEAGGAIVTNGNAGDLEVAKDLSEIQSQFDAYRAEIGDDAVRLREDLAVANKEIAKLQGDVAKERARCELANDRTTLAQEDLKSKNIELGEALKRNNALNDRWARADIELARVNEELSTSTGKLEQLRNEAANLRAEKNIWETIQRRLEDDNRSLSLEKSRLSDMMANVQKLHADNQRSLESDRRRLENQVSLLEVQIQDNRTQLTDERENVRRLTLQKDIEVKELQIRLDKANDDLSKTRESLVGAETSKKHLEQRVEDLTKFSESNKEKLAVYERHGPSTSSGSSEEVSREQQLEAELAETSAKLKMAERALEKAKDRVVQYEGMSQAAEEALLQVQATMDEYKISTESAITQRDGTIKSLEEKLATAHTDLDRATEAMKEAQKTLETEKSNWFKEKAELEGTIVDLSISGKSSESDKSAREAEVQQLRDRTKAAEERYQSEVMAHAEAIKANTTIREQLTELRSKSQENIVAADTASRKLLDSEKSWALQKENLEKEIAEHDRRFKDLQAQNKTLFQQFDDLAKSTERVRQGATEIPEGEEASPEMAAVHNYLRGQNQYLEVQLDAKNAETARLKTRCDHLTHEVDEVRTMLAQEREKAVENSQSASEHKELVDRINQMNILRESNSTLRSESERHAKRVKQLEVQLKEATAALDPVKEQARVAEAEIDATKKLLAKVEEQSKTWHDRLLAKNNGAADIPALQEELAKLKETNEALEVKLAQAEKDLEAVRGENSKLKERFAKFLDAHKRYKETSERLQKVVDGYAEEKATFEAAKAAVVAEKEALEAKVLALDAEIEKLKTTPTVSTEQHTKATDLVQRLKRHNIDLMDKAKQSTAEIEELRKEKETWEQEKAKLSAAGDSGDIEKEREQWQKEKAALLEAAAAGGDEASKILLEAEREAYQNEKDALEKQKGALEKEKDAALAKINELQAKFDELTEEHNANSKALGVFTATKNKELAALREKAVKDQEAAVQVALTKLRAELGNSDALAAANKKHAEELSSLTAQHKQDVEAAKAAAPSTSASSAPAPNSPEYEKALEEARAAGKKELEMKVRLQENRASRLTKQVQIMEKKIMRWVADGALSQEVVDTKIPEIEDAPSQPLQSAASTISASPATPSTSAAPSTLPTKPLPDAALGSAAPAARGRVRGRGGAATSASARGAAPPNTTTSATRGGAAAATRGAAAAGRGGAQRGRGRGGAAAPTGLSIQGAAAQKRPREENGAEDQQAKKPRPTPGAGS